VSIGDAFRKHANVFIKEIEKETDMNKARDRPMQDFGGLISSATILALTVELCLKALRILSGMNVPDTHHLWSLYKRLPQELKNSVEASYDKLNPKEGAEVDELQVALHVGRPSAEASQELNELPWPSGEEDLKGVLIRSSDAFATWRYLYEKGQPGKFTMLRGFVAEIVTETNCRYS